MANLLLCSSCLPLHYSRSSHSFLPDSLFKNNTHPALIPCPSPKRDSPRQRLAGREVAFTQPFSSGNSFLRKAGLNEGKTWGGEGGSRSCFCGKKRARGQKPARKSDLEMVSLRTEVSPLFGWKCLSSEQRVV